MNSRKKALEDLHVMQTNKSCIGEAEFGLERLHQCAEKELQEFLDADTPMKGFDNFRVKLTSLTRYFIPPFCVCAPNSVTHNYFENLVQALERGLMDVDSSDPQSSSRSSGSSCPGNMPGKMKSSKATEADDPS
ncbi:hypothetical protein GW17_00025889 [Ensete ventricosum]|nr:hypothetical protein GW17_00025889 [Ensete ventricosum]